ncbi:hypothetical protein PG984_010676 [Apiospora sp. TS-2023a]
MATQKLRPRTAKAPRAKSVRERRFSRTSIIKKAYSHPSSPTAELSPIEVPGRVVVATGHSGELGLDASRQRMQQLAIPIDETSSDDGKPPWRLAAKRVFPGFK